MATSAEALGAALRAARNAAGVLQDDVPVVSQARLSRMENGAALPTEAEILKLARLYRATPDLEAELLQLARDARDSRRDSRLVIQRGNTLAQQKRWRAIEGSSAVVRGYQPALVLGVLQTAAYAAVVLDAAPDSAVVAERVSRGRLLVETGRRHLLIQTEGALQQVVGSPDVHAEQLDAIAAAAALPNVELGVIPASRPLDFTAGTAFHVYDDSAVVVGLEVAAAQLADAEDIAHFRELWERLWKAAVVGDEAVALIRSLTDRR